MTISFTASRTDPTNPALWPEFPTSVATDDGHLKRDRGKKGSENPWPQTLFRLETEVLSPDNLRRGLEAIVNEAIKMSPTPVSCLLTIKDPDSSRDPVWCCWRLSANQLDAWHCGAATRNLNVKTPRQSTRQPCRGEDGGIDRFDTGDAENPDCDGTPSTLTPCACWTDLLGTLESQAHDRDVEIQWVFPGQAADSTTTSGLYEQLKQAFLRLEEEQRRLLRAESLLREHQNFVHRIARRFFLPGTEIEDVLQEGRIGLFKAICNYDPERGLPFENFASLCIRNEIHTAFKRASRQARLDMVPLDAAESAGEEPADAELSPEDRICYQAGTDNVRRLVQTHLRGIERQVFMQYLDGTTPSDICESLRLTSKQVDNAFQRAKKRLRKIPLHELV